MGTFGHLVAPAMLSPNSLSGAGVGDAQHRAVVCVAIPEVAPAEGVQPHNVDESTLTTPDTALSECSHYIERTPLRFVDFIGRSMTGRHL